MSVCPPNTLVTDYAYPELHPLRHGAEPELDDDEPCAVNRRAVALFDFTPENGNEVPLVAGQVVYITYRNGEGWLVAEDDNGSGLVPEEYVELLESDDEAKPFVPRIFQNNDDEWEDTDEELEERMEKTTIQ